MDVPVHWRGGAEKFGFEFGRGAATEITAPGRLLGLAGNRIRRVYEPGYGSGRRRKSRW